MEILHVKRISLCLVAVIGVFAGAARAQSPSLQSPRLNLSISAGAPGAETQVQFTLAGPPAMALGRIEAIISFPVETLDFQKVAGYLLDMEAVKVETDVQAPKEGRRIMLVTVRSGEADKPLPATALFDLHFTVAKGAKLGVLALDMSAKAFGLDGREVAPVNVFGGRINIQDPAIFFGCFFYMH